MNLNCKVTWKLLFNVTFPSYRMGECSSRARSYEALHLLDVSQDQVDDENDDREEDFSWKTKLKNIQVLRFPTNVLLCLITGEQRHRNQHNVIQATGHN